MRLVMAILLAPVMLACWPVDAIRHRLKWRRIRREAEARRRDYDAAGWV